MKKTILEEALADAKVLKAMALEQAKITIAESMTPAIEAALSSQLKKDLLEGDEYEDESAQPEDEAKDGKSVMEAISKLGLDETTLAAISKALGENKKAPATDDEEEEEEEETNESFDLDAALAEIESKETEEDRAAVKEEAEADDEEENMDESLDIDAILAEMDDDSDDTLEDGDEEGEGDDEENEDLSDAGKEGEDTSKPEENEDDELDEAALFEKFKAFVKGEKVASSAPPSKVPASKFKEKGASIASEATINESATVKELRNELKDLNVLAAKLLYQNKTILATNLTESQKAKVIVAFDKVKTVDEAKLIFETLSVKNTTKTTKRKPLAESLGFISLGKKTITESAQPSGTQYTEEQKLMMKRAGIKI